MSMFATNRREVTALLTLAAAGSVALGQREAAPAARSASAATADTLPLPADFDPTSLPVSGAVLATWADGHAERVARLIDQWLAGSPEAAKALHLLRPEPNVVQQRARQLHAEPAKLSGPLDAELVRRFLPEIAAEQAIHALLGRNDRSPRQTKQLLQSMLPVDAAVLTAIQRRLADPSQQRRDEALSMLDMLGPHCHALLPALEAALPGFSAKDLRRLPFTLLAIAPEALIRLCEPLLDHTDPDVASAMLHGPYGTDHDPIDTSLRIAEGEAFAIKIATRLCSPEGQKLTTAWFVGLTNGAAALPTLRQGLREYPTREGIAQAIGQIGRPAALALPELLAAAPHNKAAIRALTSVLPTPEALTHLLPLLGTENEPLVAPLLGPLCRWKPGREDPAAIAVLERFAQDAREPARAQVLRLLAESDSSSLLADESRCELLSRAPAIVPFLAKKHWERLWPRLTAAQRDAVWPRLGERRELLPSNIADYLASKLDGGNEPDALRILLDGAPLHTRVCELVDAAEQASNLPVTNPGASLGDLQARSIVNLWAAGDADFRARALPWLRRHPRAAVEAAERITADPSRFPEWPAPELWGTTTQRRLAGFEVLQALALPGSDATVWRHLEEEEDLAIRRAALLTAIATQPNHEAKVARLQGLILQGSFEERFGPVEGLPPICAEALATMPSPAERAGKLRRSLLLRPETALWQLALDLEAVRLLLPELQQLLRPGNLEECALVLLCLRRLGPDAKELLPAIEALVPIPRLHFEAQATARILRGEAPIEPMAPRPDWQQYR